MLITLGLMIIGIFLGRFLRGRRNVWVSPGIMITVCLLLYVMGIRVALNKEIMDALSSTGLIALILFAFATGGSVVLTWLFTKYVIDRRHKPAKSAAVQQSQDNAAARAAKGGGAGAFRDSAIILGWFILGLLTVLLRFMPEGFYELDFVGYSNWILYAMLFLVGLNIGIGESILTLVKQLPRKVLWIPLVLFAGTWIGAILAYFVIQALGFDLEFRKTFTICSAVGYYSLSAIMTTQVWGATVGAICLLTNLLRELFTIIAAKPLGKYFGRYASISAGGATITDTNLPIILKAEGNAILPVILYVGIIINIAVPFMLALLVR